MEHFHKPSLIWSSTVGFTTLREVLFTELLHTGVWMICHVDVSIFNLELSGWRHGTEKPWGIDNRKPCLMGFSIELMPSIFDGIQEWWDGLTKDLVECRPIGYDNYRWPSISPPRPLPYIHIIIINMSQLECTIGMSPQTIEKKRNKYQD